VKDVLFVNANPKNEFRKIVNGTMILATKLINAGFDVDILRFYQVESHDKGDYHKFIDDITDRIISAEPKCVSFYTLWPFYHILLRIAQRLKSKNPDIIIVMGGPQSSATAYETMKAMSFVDYVATGEGENTVVPFFESILRNNRKNIGNIPGLYYREDGKVKFCSTPIQFCDLNSIPRWHESLYDVNENDLDSNDYYMPLDVGRGCPFECTFCCTSVFWKKAYRLKTSEKILEDIRYFNHKFGIKSFMFSHDAFTTNKELVLDVCDAIIDSGLNITWKCSSRADCITEDLVMKMKAAGMNCIEMGIETGSPRMQKIINKKLNLDKVKDIVGFLLKNDIKVTLFFMYGFPDETEEDLNQTLNMYCELLEMGVRQTVLGYCMFTPSTEITRQCFDELVFVPELKILSREVFGFNEECEMFKNNKDIFPHFYHLNTVVRNNYQNLFYFGLLYEKFSNVFKFIRAYYNKNMLKLYKDFYNNNIDVFNEETDNIWKNIVKNHSQVMKNTVKNLDKNIADRFNALIDYSVDYRRVSKSKEDIRIQKKYAFNYIEYQLQLPIEQFSDSSSELIIEKKNGKISVQIVSV